MEWAGSFQAGKSSVNSTLLPSSYPQIRRYPFIDSLCENIV